MTERTVKVKLTAQMQEYIAGMEKAAQATRETAKEGDKLAETKKAFDLLGRASVGAGGLVAVGLGVAIAKFADFDAAMSNVAATGEDARENMDALTEAAIDAGASTVYSATEAANAIEELAKAGVSAKDIMGGGLAGALDLAAAGGLGVADAAGIAATALKTFNLEGDDMAHVADLLAAGAGKAMGDVSDLSQALNQSALVANKTGLTIEETTAGLAAFASQGLLGSDAGTSFKTMLLSLNPASAEAATLMEDLNLSAYDQQGRFVGLAEYAGKLETALGGMSAEQQNATLKTIFGNDAYRAAAVLLDEGAAGITEWTAAVDDQGYAAETAALKLDNLKGDVEALSGAIDSALIGMGEAADGPIRGLVQGFTGVVDTFNDLPEGAQQAAFWIGVAGAAALTSYGTYLLAVPKLHEYNTALATMGPNAQRAGRGMAALSKGVGIVAALGTATVMASNALVDYAREIRGTDDAVSKALTTNLSFTDAMDELGITTEATSESVVRALDAIGEGNTLGPVGLDVLSLRDTLSELDRKMTDLPLENAVDKFQAWGDELGLSTGQMSTMLNELPNLKDAIREQLTTTGQAADKQAILRFALQEGTTATKDSAAALEDLQGVANDTNTAVGTLEESLREFGSATFDTERASLAFEAALDDLTDTLTGDDGSAVGSLDKTTEAGRETLAAMLEVAESTNDYAASVAGMGGSTEEVQGILEAGRQKIIDTRIALGDSETAAKAYADQLILTPDNIQTAVTLAGIDIAQQRISSFISAINSVPRQVTVGFTGETIAGNPSLGYPQFAEGGAIFGPGTATSDSVPILASTADGPEAVIIKPAGSAAWPMIVSLPKLEVAR